MASTRKEPIMVSSFGCLPMRIVEVSRDQLRDRFAAMCAQFFSDFIFQSIENIVVMREVPLLKVAKSSI